MVLEIAVAERSKCVGRGFVTTFKTIQDDPNSAAYYCFRDWLKSPHKPKLVKETKSAWAYVGKDAKGHDIGIIIRPADIA